MAAQGLARGARAVAGEEHEGAAWTDLLAGLGDGDCWGVEDFGKHRFEGRIGAVHGVDEKDRSDGRGVKQRIENRAPNHVGSRKELPLDIVRGRARQLAPMDAGKLEDGVPFIQGVAGLDAGVALEADEPSARSASE